MSVGWLQWATTLRDAESPIDLAFMLTFLQRHQAHAQRAPIVPFKFDTGSSPQSVIIDTEIWIPPWGFSYVFPVEAIPATDENGVGWFTTHGSFTGSVEVNAHFTEL